MSLLTSAARTVLSRVPSPVPRRQRRLTGQAARVDTIPYAMPVSSEDSPVLMAAFPISLSAARAVLPGSELHPVSLGFGRGVLMATVVNYRSTDIGQYIEYSLAIAVTHGPRPAPVGLPLQLAAANYCAFRGQLMRSTIYFEATGDVAVGPGARARIVLGDAPGVQPLRALQIGSKPLFTAWLPTAHGVLDDHYEAWFLTGDTLGAVDASLASGEFGEPLESVVGLGRGETWPPPPDRSRPEVQGRVAAGVAT